MPERPTEKALRLLARSLRFAIGLVTVGLIVWAFVRVGARPLRRTDDGVHRTQISVLHWGDKNEDKIVADLVHDFENLPENSDIRIMRVNLGQGAAVNTKLQTMFAAGDPADVFYLGHEKVADFASKDLLANIDDLIAADRAAGVPTLDLNDFFASVLKSFRFDGRRIGTGPLVGVPKDFTTVGFYYNRDLFRKAGLPEPSPEGWTWDDFLAAARAIGKLPNCYGADFVTWESMIRVFLWTHGLDFGSNAWERFHFNDPDVHAVIEKLQSWFHDEDRTLVSAKTQLETGLEPFLAGNVGLAGPFGRWKVPTYRLITDFDWDFAPLPQALWHRFPTGAHGEHRLETGATRETGVTSETGATRVTPRNGIFTVAWAIARSSPRKPEAWRFIKYLSGQRAQELMCRGGLAIPVLRSVAESPVFSDPSQKPRNYRVYLDAADYADPIDWPADPKYQHQLRVRLEDIFKLDRPVAPALARVQREWEKNAEFEHAYGPMPWRSIAAIGGTLAALIVVVALGVWWIRRPGGIALREEAAGYAMVSPWVIGFAAFTAFPILLSLLLALAKWSGMTTLDHAEWFGFRNLAALWTADAAFRRALYVTALYALMAVPLGQIAALGAALLMNHPLRSIGLFRAVWYLPSVLAGVGMAVMWKWVFHHEHGLLKAVLDPLLAPFGWTAPAVFEKDADAWGVPAFAIVSLWSIGGTMMIYLAGLKGISRELYEAAEIDGATAWTRFFRVTLPMLSPVIFFNVIIAIISSFQIFTQAYVMTAGGPGDATRFYVLWLYNQAFDFHQMGYASAMAWMLLVIILALTGLLMATTKRFVYYEALKT